jgi:hypothetical protein
MYSYYVLGVHVYFLHIVMKVALFYTQNFTRKIVVKVVLFCIILFHLLGDDCQSIPIFFFCNFS